MFTTIQQKAQNNEAAEQVKDAVGKVTTTMLFNNGINYNPFNPMGQHDGRKSRKAAEKVTSLVTKVRNETMFRPW
eukprot:CAMPEP_0196717656 /NCGR_PEP_ID=MMETSP1091-20130531/1019_1 /TAXON_ID=302021 /ORGANISM="Rhodomonas sp., Strain CCMP768" /LENGTH=74 /DNA_ID=CAMNT_0042058083 /DNA_START=10 /DNA_END=234 /DNA_ORIENTATION=+